MSNKTSLRNKQPNYNLLNLKINYNMKYIEWQVLKPFKIKNQKLKIV